MSKSSAIRALCELLSKFLSPADLVLFRGEVSQAEPEEYNEIFTRVARTARKISRQVSYFETRVQERYGDLIEQPEGRRFTLLANSPPQLLLVLTRSLLRQSYAERFEDVRRSLELAELADQVSERAVQNLSSELATDLRAEALAYVANARRISGDLQGAQHALFRAARHQEHGTGDRHLKGLLLSFRADLCYDFGLLEESAELHLREAALWRLLRDDGRLAIALLGRGRALMWTGSTEQAVLCLREAADITPDPSVLLATLLPISESLAREGRAALAWKVVCNTDVAIILNGGTDPQIVTRQKWIRGLAYRAMGDLDSAERDLASARDDLASQGLAFRAALVSLDLACVYAAQGRTKDLKELAAEAHAEFIGQGVEGEAMVAFLAFHQAAVAESLSEALALEVANFLARYQRNRNLRFEWPEE